MKILLLCGSIAQKSHTRALLTFIQTLFQEKDCETTFWDLKDKPLPDAIPEYHKDPSRHPDNVVKEFVSVVGEVDGVVLGSPLYHGSYSGVLKNALDNLHADAFRDKWIGLVGNASGPRADNVQFAHLRVVVRALVGYCIQTQIGTHKGDYEELENEYVLKDEDIKQRCHRLVDEIVKLISKYADHKN